MNKMLDTALALGQAFLRTPPGQMLKSNHLFQYICGMLWSMSLVFFQVCSFSLKQSVKVQVLLQHLMATLIHAFKSMLSIFFNQSSLLPVRVSERGHHFRSCLCRRNGECCTCLP